MGAPVDGSQGGLLRDLVGHFAVLDVAPFTDTDLGEGWKGRARRPYGVRMAAMRSAADRLAASTRWP